MAQQPLNMIVGFAYKHVTTGTNVLKASPGMLDRIVVNSVGSSATLTIYDNTAGSGAVIGIPSFTTALVAPLVIIYDAIATIGLTVVVSGTIDATFMFR